MRLNKRSSGGLAGPLGVVALLTIVGLGVCCPELNNAFATMVTNPDGSVTDTGILNTGFTVTERVKSDETVTFDPATSETGFVVEHNERADKTNKSEDFDLGFAVVERAGTVSTSKTFSESGDHKILGVEVEEYLEISDVTDMTMAKDGTDPNLYVSSTNFTVSGNNANGFSVYVTAEDSDSTSLNPVTSGNTSKIQPTVLTNGAVADFDDNTWGYKLSDGLVAGYHGLKALGSASYDYKTETPLAGKTFTLSCAAKVNTSSLTPDTYQTTATVSAVAPFSATLIAPAAAP